MGSIYSFFFLFWPVVFLYFYNLYIIFPAVRLVFAAGIAVSNFESTVGRPPAHGVAWEPQWSWHTEPRWQRLKAFCSKLAREPIGVVNDSRVSERALGVLFYLESE